MSSLLAPLGGALLCLAPLAQDPGRGNYEVSLHGSLDGPMITVRADQAPALPVMREIARAADLSLMGSDRLVDASSLTIYLTDRPLDEALEWILGSLGLSGQIQHGTLTIQGELPPFPERSAVDDRAELAYLGALEAAPEHTQAARAEFTLAQIQERRGAWESAVKHYEFLAESFPDSSLVSEALWRAANHWKAAKEWNRAAARYTDVANATTSAAYAVGARVELALMQCNLESPKKALYILDALEHNYPTQEPRDMRARLLVRARALALTDKPVDALRILDVLPADDENPEAAHGVLEVRALALERCGRTSDAALAWLAFAKSTDGSRRDEAVIEAARLTLASDDQVGVLLIESWARSVGATSDLSSYANEARMRLGLTPPDPTTMTDLQWLARGEQLVERGAMQEAVQALEPLYHRRNRLGRGERMRLSMAFARALHDRDRSSYAMSVLRDCVKSLEALEDRARIYTLASDLLEADGRYEDAMRALQGEL